MRSTVSASRALALRTSTRESYAPAGACGSRAEHAPVRVAGAPALYAHRPMRFEHVLVVGAGQMGGGIAQVVAASGRRVSLHDAAPGAVERGLEAMRKSLTRLAEKGGPDPGEVLGRVEPVDDLVSADLMVEAVV